MRLNEIQFNGAPPIDSYGPGGFRIAGNWFDGSLILLPSGIHAINDLTLAEVSPLVEAGAQIDVVLIGQGSEISPLAPEIRNAIEASGPGAEVMSTPSACRTYNVLLAEDRRVAAILTAM
ncbi:MAG: Mth938-like domain-containing protein [Pseudomonadota bacterium]